jgi:hypothetical protein
MCLANSEPTFTIKSICHSVVDWVIDPNSKYLLWSAPFATSLCRQVWGQVLFFIRWLWFRNVMSLSQWNINRCDRAKTSKVVVQYGCISSAFAISVGNARPSLVPEGQEIHGAELSLRGVRLKTCSKSHWGEPSPDLPTSLAAPEQAQLSSAETEPAESKCLLLCPTTETWCLLRSSS